MIIPFNQISPEALDGIIEAYILREGTDYGLHEYSMADKKAQVRTQLEQGEIVLVYSELHETVNLLPYQQFTESKSSL